MGGFEWRGRLLDRRTGEPDVCRSDLERAGRRAQGVSCLRLVEYVVCVERECTDGLGIVERSQRASWKVEVDVRAEVVTV